MIEWFFRCVKSRPLSITIIENNWIIALGTRDFMMECFCLNRCDYYQCGVCANFPLEIILRGVFP